MEHPKINRQVILRQPTQYAQSRICLTFVYILQNTCRTQGHPGFLKRVLSLGAFVP